MKVNRWQPGIISLPASISHSGCNTPMSQSQRSPKSTTVKKVTLKNAKAATPLSPKDCYQIEWQSNVQQNVVAYNENTEYAVMANKKRRELDMYGGRDHSVAGKRKLIKDLEKRDASKQTFESADLSFLKALRHTQRVYDLDKGQQVHLPDDSCQQTKQKPLELVTRHRVNQSVDCNKNSAVKQLFD